MYFFLSVAKDSVSDLFSTAQDVNKAVENLVQVMTDDDDEAT